MKRRSGRARRIYCSAHRSRKYGLKAKEVDLLHCVQNGLCLCCLMPLSDFVIDHDHDTGDVRGILCSSCNLLLGHMGDNADEIKRRSEMLLRYLSSGAERTKKVVSVLKSNGKRKIGNRWTSRLAYQLSDIIWYDSERMSVLVDHLNSTTGQAFD